MKDKLLTQSYKLNGAAVEFGYDWIPEETTPRKHDYSYDGSLTNQVNAAILADNVVDRLRKDYSVINVDPCPKAVSVWGERWFGAEVFIEIQKER